MLRIQENQTMLPAVVGLCLGLLVGAGCRFFDIPSPAPPRLMGAGLLLAMTLGFIAADHLLAPGAILIDWGKP
jgi:XapX domain-containing protein